jgi:hypothetical protein
MNTVIERIAALDTSLFDAIYSQLYPEDKKSLLAIQHAVAGELKEYSYLEIGSYMGGSIQPHLLDHRCTGIISIDKRPHIPPDDRGIIQEYPENSTQTMLSHLSQIGTTDKVRCFEADAADLDRSVIDPRPNLCFIDGEHTERAVISDFTFCRSVMSDRGLIVFHDSHIIFNGLQHILTDLQKEGVMHTAYVLPRNVFLLEFGELSVWRDPSIHDMLINNHTAYLAGLSSMEHYRDVYNSGVVRVLRGINRTVRNMIPRRLL